LKADPRSRFGLLSGESVCLYFGAPSVLSRVAIQTAVARLGGVTIVLDKTELAAPDRQILEERVRVLSRFAQAFVVHSLDDEDVARCAQAASVPVVNALSEGHQPCQSVADLLTLFERRGSFKNCRIAYVGEGNAAAASLMEAAALAGADITLASPKAYALSNERVEAARAVAAESGSSVLLTEDPEEALRGADALYAGSLGSPPESEQEKQARLRALGPYQVTRRSIELAKRDAVLLHGLTPRAGEALSPAAFDGAESVVFDQAENGCYAVAAILSALFKGKLEGRGAG